MPPRQPPANAALDAEAIRRAEQLLADRRRSLAATVADLCALFDDLARVKRERDEAEAWWRAVLAHPVPVGRAAPRGFANKRADYDGPTFYTLADVRLDVLEVSCEKCGLTATARVADLLSLYGPTASLPGVLIELSAHCPKRRAANFSDWCGLVYVGPTGVQR